MAKLRQLRPDLCILKSLVVKEDNADELLQLVDQCASYVDMFITDTYNPKTGAKGATGLTHNWDVSAELVKRSPKPLMLAGGLTPDNVAAAIRHVRPAAVDAHTGLEGADVNRPAVDAAGCFFERSSLCLHNFCRCSRRITALRYL
jgi:phosphoribosylanthranilate isomerase